MFELVPVRKLDQPVGSHFISDERMREMTLGYFAASMKAFESLVQEHPRLLFSIDAVEKPEPGIVVRWVRRHG